MVLTEDVHQCLHFIVISLGIREKKITSDMFCYPPNPLMWAIVY